MCHASLGVCHASLGVGHASLGVCHTSLGVCHTSLGVRHTSLGVLHTSLACVRHTSLAVLSLLSFCAVQNDARDSSDDAGPVATGSDIVDATVSVVSCNLRFFEADRKSI